MSYVDGFVAAVPTANRDAYRVHAEKALAVFKEHGATRCVEAWGDDVPDGKVTSFPLAVQRKPEETVVFSWVEWPSKEARDAGWQKIMADPRMQPDANPMPFDGQRLIYKAMKRPAYGADRLALMQLELKTHAKREIAPGWDRSADACALSADGGTVYCTADDLGQKPLFAIDVAHSTSIVPS